MKDFEVEEGREVVGRTIVGGRPRARHQKRLRVPIGIEKVLARAAADPTFRVALFADRRAAIDDAGYEMLASELTVLESVPEGVLASMIGRIDLRKHGQRKFMRGVVAAAFASAAATSSLLGCENAGASTDIEQHFDVLGDTAQMPEEIVDPGQWPEATAGIDPGQPPDEVLDNASWPDMGVTADVPEETLDAPDDAMVHGVEADEPEEEAVEPDVALDIDETPMAGGILPEEPEP
jgi:hypothetical protein